MKQAVFQFACLFFAVLLIPVAGMAQQETYDLITYSPPSGWVSSTWSTIFQPFSRSPGDDTIHYHKRTVTAPKPDKSQTRLFIK